jgi:three-Cys-motif partner protein
MENQFGGPWTQKKLEALTAYLQEYEKIFTRNERASFFKRIYMDGFAGTGSILLSSDASEEVEGREYLEGSAAIALNLPEGFHEYVFIDKDAKNVSDLEHLKKRFRDKSERIKILKGDANTLLQDWCQKTDWKKCRALVFLDPYGMQLDWSTIETIAKTKAIDLWLLFPLGQGVMRMLTNRGIPPPDWSEKLTRFFGTEEWKSEFYTENPQESLFGDGQTDIKIATYENIKQYFLKRLSSIFEKVANPMELKNSTGSPLFLLCFAASNPKGAPIAIRIANYILGEKEHGYQIIH